MLPLSVRQIAFLLGQEHENETLIFSATVDSRKRGDLFFALTGSKVDSHQFLGDVAANGAKVAVVLDSYEGPAFGLALIRVPHVLEALQQLARLFIEKHRPKIVAVTGSLGKTTTKDFLTTLLKSCYNVYSDPGNANSQVGLALSILSLRGDEEVAVLEMGMSEEGNIRALTTIAPPDVAILTTVALVHAMNFTGLSAIARGKAEIFSHPRTRLGLYSADMPHPEEAARSGTAPKLTFSVLDAKASYYAKLSEGEIALYEEGQQMLKAPWTILGRHNIQNFLAAAAAARQMGVTWQDIKEAIPRLKLPNNRLQLVQKGSRLFLSDAYNANKNSICSALETLQALPHKGRRVAVLSEILELGAFAEAEHQEVAHCALKTVDHLYCIGPGAKLIKEIFDREEKPCFYCEDKDVLKEALTKELQEGDVVLLKGGRRYNLSDLVEHF